MCFNMFKDEKSTKHAVFNQETTLKDYELWLHSLPEKKRIEHLNQKSTALGLRLRESRKQKGYTQEQIANMIGVTKQSISGYEKGVKKPSTKTLDTLCLIYGVQLSYILGIPKSFKHVETNEVMELLNMMHSINHTNFIVEYKTLNPNSVPNLSDEKQWLSSFINDLMEDLTVEQLYQLKNNIALSIISNISQ